jgi:16S rRNA G1207 methylase RsmC
MGTVKAIVKGAPQVLADKGTFQMVIRSKIGSKALPAFFEETFGNVRVLARGGGFRVLLGQHGAV